MRDFLKAACLALAELACLWLFWVTAFLLGIAADHHFGASGVPYDAALWMAGFAAVVVWIVDW